MSTVLKCPNPSCPYVFDPSAVPTGVVLACPQCAMRFTLGPPTPPPPGHYPGAARPGYPPPGYAAPPPPPAPAADPAFGDMTPETARADDEDGPRLPVRGSKLQTVLLVGVAAVALTAAGIAVWWKVTHKPGPDAADGGTRYGDLNLSVAPPPAPWVRDEEARVKLGGPFFAVYRRADPEAYVAVGGHPFDPSSPRPSDLSKGLADALDRLLEKDTRKEYRDEVDRTWMGQEVRGYKFTGMAKADGKLGGAVEGEAMAVAHKGVGYWFLAWTAADAFPGQKAAFADARRRCKLLELRNDWAEKRSPVAPYKNTGLGYAIYDAEGMWKEEEDRKRVRDEDPKADKYLTAKLRQKGRGFHEEEAELVVLVLDGGGDPLADARAYVEARANADVETRGRNTFAEHTGALEGEPTPNTVDGAAPHVVLRSRNDRDPSYTWLYVVSAVKVGDRTVAVCAKCKWGLRAAFDTKFVQIAKSLRAE